MANEFYTLIVVPHAKARFRKFQVSVRLTKWVTGAAATLALLLAGILTHYTWISVEVGELRRLRTENLALATKAQAYEQNAGKLQTKVLALQNMVMKLGVMAGLEKSLPDPQVGGVGGLSSIETTPPALDVNQSMRSLDQKVSDLTEKSSKLQVFFQDQKLLLASTPSIWPVRGYLSAVIFCGVRGGYGNAMVIDHGYGVVSRYAHLASFNVRPGQRIHRGDVIAFVGNTGRSTAPHLHYEVWVNDQAQNPIQYILDEYRSFG